jgi:hypothetical protein
LSTSRSRSESDAIASRTIAAGGPAPPACQRRLLGLAAQLAILDRVADLEHLAVVAGTGWSVERANVCALELAELPSYLAERNAEHVGQLGLGGRAAVLDEEVVACRIDLTREMAHRA